MAPTTHQSWNTGLPGRHLLELVRDGFENFEVLLGALAADPADEAELEARTQAARPLRHGERGFAGTQGDTGAAC